MNADGTNQKRLTNNTVIRHFVHGNLFSNSQYYYRVRAFNAGGKSAYTDVVSAKTLRK